LNYTSIIPTIIELGDFQANAKTGSEINQNILGYTWRCRFMRKSGTYGHQSLPTFDYFPAVLVTGENKSGSQGNYELAHNLRSLLYLFIFSLLETMKYNKHSKYGICSEDLLLAPQFVSLDSRAR
jgi:hypothetical protein